MSKERHPYKCCNCEARLTQAEADAGAALVEGQGFDTICEDCARKLGASASTDRATPRPWSTGSTMTSVEVWPAGWNVPMQIADCHAKHAPDSEQERVANAALIVAAVNSFGALRYLAELVMSTTLGVKGLRLRYAARAALAGLPAPAETVNEKLREACKALLHEMSGFLGCCGEDEIRDSFQNFVQACDKADAALALADGKVQK